MSILARNLVRSSLASNRTSLSQALKRYLSTSSTDSQASSPPETPTKAPAELDAELKQLRETMSARETEAKDFKDKYMRALAEVENIRARMLKQVDDAKVFGIQSFCKDLLEVADVLNLAIKNTDPSSNSKKGEESHEQLKAMFNGLVMTEKSLLKIFEKHGLTQISPQKGDPFDPNLHDAIFRVPDAESTSGTIFTSTKTGFVLRGRVIRAAQVGVVQ